MKEGFLLFSNYYLDGKNWDKGAGWDKNLKP